MKKKKRCGVEMWQLIDVEPNPNHLLLCRIFNWLLSQIKIEKHGQKSADYRRVHGP